MGTKIQSFGLTKQQEETALVTIFNQNGMEIQVTNYGATLVSAMVPNKEGAALDVILGYDDVSGYINNGGYFGAVIGRNGNRIGGSVVTINGREYQMDQNEKSNNLHSGFHGFDKVIWDMELPEDGQSVKFHHNSPALEQGLPGNVAVTVTYTLTQENEIQIKYHGISDEDTILNMTNHSYFNLAGHNSGSVEGQILWLDSDAFTVIDEESIPTGELRNVEGTVMDFRTAKRIGDGINDSYEQIQVAGGYDHNYVLRGEDKPGIRKVVEVLDPGSGRKMEVFTDCVGVQFYSGNYIENTQIGKGNYAYQKRSGFCLETQFYPDACHHENFPSSILRAGEDYDTVTIYKFS